MVTRFEVVGRNRRNVFEAWLFEPAIPGQWCSPTRSPKNFSAREYEVDPKLRELKLADERAFS